MNLDAIPPHDPGAERYGDRPRLLLRAIRAGWDLARAESEAKTAPPEGQARRVGDVLASILADVEAAQEPRP